MYPQALIYLAVIYGSYNFVYDRSKDSENFDSISR